MKKYIIYPVFLLILFSSHETKGQSIYFNKSYDIDSLKPNNAGAVVQLADSGFVTISCIFASTYGGYSFIRTNKIGDTSIVKTYRYTWMPINSGGGALIKTYDNCLIFSGVIADSSGINQDAFFVKFALNGDTIWTKRIGGIDDDASLALILAPDSGFYSIGYTQSNNNGLSDFYLVKLDKNGLLQWQNQYGSPGSEDGMSIYYSPDGNLLLGGIKSGEMYIIKVSLTGNFMWDKVLSNTIGFGQVYSTPDGNIYMAGGKMITASDENGLVVKLDSAGNIIWEKNFGWLNDQDEIFSSPVYDSLTQMLYYTGNTLGSGSVFGWLLAIDTSGLLQWQHTYYRIYNQDNYFYSLKRTSDNGFILAGFAMVTGQDAWLVKVDSNGCETPNCPVGINEIYAASNNSFIYPNPFNHFGTLQFTTPNLTSLELRIINVSGQIIETKFMRAGEQQIVIDGQELPAGIYFVLIMSEGVVTEATKFVVEH